MTGRAERASQEPKPKTGKSDLGNTVYTCYMHVIVYIYITLTHYILYVFLLLGHSSFLSGEGWSWQGELKAMGLLGRLLASLHCLHEHSQREDTEQILNNHLKTPLKQMQG